MILHLIFSSSLATGAEIKNTTERKTNEKSQDKVVKPVPCTGMSRMNLLKQEQEMLDKAVEMGNGIRLASDPFKMCMVFRTKRKADTGTHSCCPNTLATHCTSPL